MPRRTYISVWCLLLYLYIYNYISLSLCLSRARAFSYRCLYFRFHFAPLSPHCASVFSLSEINIFVDLEFSILRTTESPSCAVSPVTFLYMYFSVLSFSLSYIYTRRQAFLLVTCSALFPPFLSRTHSRLLSLFQCTLTTI